jgi:hypothetical protein
MDRLPFPIINSRTDMKNHMIDSNSVSDTLIEEFLNVPDNLMKTDREQYLLRETIYSLMRLSKSEQMLAIRKSVDYLVPASLLLQPVTGGKRKRRSQSPYPGQSWLALGK